MARLIDSRSARSDVGVAYVSCAALAQERPLPKSAAFIGAGIETKTMNNAAAPGWASEAGDPGIWAAYFRLHLCDLRPDLAPAETGRLATDAWDAARLLQPSHAAELVATAIDRRATERRSKAGRR